MDQARYVANGMEKNIQDRGKRRGGYSLLRAVKYNDRAPLVTFVDRAFLLLNALCVQHPAVDEDVRLLVEVADPLLVRVDVGIQQLVLLDQVLDGREVLAVVLSVQHVLNLEPIGINVNYLPREHALGSHEGY